MSVEVVTRKIPGKSLGQLQAEHGLDRRQMSLMRANMVSPRTMHPGTTWMDAASQTPSLLDDWKQRRRVNQRVLGSAEKLVERVHYSSLLFAEIPDMLTVKAVKKSSDLRLIAVPVFPFEHSADIMQALETNPASPYVDIYGKEPLRVKANGTLEVNKSGHYVFMNEQGANAKLWHDLGLNGNRDISLEKVQNAIEETGKFILRERKLNGATIDVATLEEVKIHNALYPENPIYGLTSTRVPGTTNYVRVTPDGYHSAKSTDIDVNPLLVIRLSNPDMVHLPPFVEKTTEPEPTTDSAPVVDVFVGSSRELRVTPPHLRLSPPQRWRRREEERQEKARRQEAMVSTSKT